jgi:hypothetical protein
LERPLRRQKCRLENNTEESWGENLREWEMYRNGKENCTMAGFGICGNETSTSPKREFFLETKAQVKIRPPTLY